MTQSDDDLDPSVRALALFTDEQLDDVVTGRAVSDPEFDELLAQLRVLGESASPSPRADLAAAMAGPLHPRRRGRRIAGVVAIAVTVSAGGLAGAAAASEAVRAPVTHFVHAVMRDVGIEKSPPPGTPSPGHPAHGGSGAPGGSQSTGDGSTTSHSGGQGSGHGTGGSQGNSHAHQPPGQQKGHGSGAGTGSGGGQGKGKGHGHQLPGQQKKHGNGNGNGNQGKHKGQSKGHEGHGKGQTKGHEGKGQSKGHQGKGQTKGHEGKGQTRGPQSWRAPPVRRAPYSAPPGAGALGLTDSGLKSASEVTPGLMFQQSPDGHETRRLVRLRTRGSCHP